MIDSKFYIRQTDLADPSLLTQSIGIIGAGSIGSWTTLALSKMGCSNITVYDYDSVEDANIGSQLFSNVDVGKPKIEALSDKIRLLTESSIETKALRITRDNIDELLFHNIIIMAVDNIESRSAISNKIPENWIGTFIDARMAGNALEIYTIPYIQTTDSTGVDPLTRSRIEFYKTTLFEPSEASPIRCSSRVVVYNVFIVGGLIADIVAKLSRNEDVPQELVMDLANFTLYGGL
jgi:tRNA A37 threonylcarbamoyladenosine dehydratase